MLFSQLTKREILLTPTARFIMTPIMYVGLFLCALHSISAHAEKLFLFDIAKQTANTSLSLFGQQTKQTLIYSYELTKTYTTNNVSGYYNKEQALTLLLRNTGLTAVIADNGQITIVKNTVSLPKASNDNREQVQRKIATQPINQSIEKIAVVGSRNLSRSVAELSVPVDILTGDALLATGETELGRMIQKLAPSFNFSSSSISDGTDVLKPATLRGLGPDQTLILINGKRRHHASLIHINTSVGRGTAGADLSAIPPNAIERIEILRDGAAAQYGSDAIAGVINIVLKAGENKNNASVTLGQFSQGDGETANSQWSFYTPLGKQGYLNTALSLTSRNSTNRAGLHGSCLYVTCNMLDLDTFQTDDPREIAADRHTFRIGDPKSKQYSIAYNSAYTLAGGSLYSFAVHANRHNNSAAYFREPNNQLANPILADDHATKRDGYLPTIHSDIEDTSFTLGYKGLMFNDYFYDISYTYGKNSINYVTENSINASFANAMQTTLTPKQIRQQLPSSAKAYGLSLSLQTLNLDINRNFDHFDAALGIEVRKDQYKVLPGEPYSYRDYDNDVSDLLPLNALPGIQGFPGIPEASCVKEDRDVLSIYAEANKHINNVIDITGAIRFDDYDGVNDTSNAKLSAKWQVSDGFTLRSSLSTGFRAPSMQQLYFNNTSTQFLVGEDQQVSAEQIGTFRNNSALAKAIGIPRLKAEKSTNFSLGGVLTFNNVELTLDYYAIHIDDRIVISNKLGAEYSSVLALELAKHHIDKAQVFLNAADTETKGLDFITTWNHQLDVGHLSLTFAANITKTEVIKLNSPKANELKGLAINQVFSDQDISIIEEWQPQDRLSLIANLQNEKWQFNVAINRYGAYTITDGNSQRFEPEWLTDMRINYHFSKSLQLFSGINNLFDVMPDKNKIGNSHAGTIIDGQGKVIVDSDGVFKYSRRSAPFGVNGQYLYLGLQYTF